MSAKHDSKRSKTDVLIEEGTFNPTPDKVRDPKFQGSEFFDPLDVVQVKYEMLRRVSIDKVSVTEASDEYGVSRPTYYQAEANFDLAGIAGLVPAKTGPRGPHKIDAVLAFLQARLVPGEPVRARELAKLVRRELAIELHPERSSGY
ncbi:helix-turn-helix domain-containing protein (plasmid) [Rhizobium sp. CB3090]|uniref:helix-turn-helix domain-containing protein n=1 Tax=Rhizobium sp. CB3090 TaxID=3039156 RepID=UPI0024B19A2C|nr:helix-turn-helix domain-containing protein [Rhizobium sp. CB3090]WFU12181.1 helix-turn-helix domain-containing protein [Rhizobium sp. CB3090]